MTGPLAVVGCGAIADLSYFPALAADPSLRAATWLVEPSLDRGRAAAAKFGFPVDQVVADQDALPASIRVAINATPSHLHRGTTLALIERGVSVLVEKPFAETLADARAMVDAAAGRCVLGVNQFRRLGPSNAMARAIVRSGQLGRLRRISWIEGHKFDWPTQSGFYFRRPWNGRPRGVLLDIGVHVLDLICWWLDAAPTVRGAVMDGHGGPEATVSATLRAGEAEIDLRLSILAKLDNRFVIEGTQGALRGSTADYDRLEIRKGDGPWRTLKAPGTTDKIAIATRLIGNLVAAADGREPLLIPADSTLAPLGLIDTLYETAEDVLPRCYAEWDGSRPAIVLPFPEKQVA